MDGDCYFNSRSITYYFNFNFPYKKTQATEKEEKRKYRKSLFSVLKRITETVGIKKWFCLK